MKRALSLVLCMAMLVLLAACGGSGSSVAPGPATSAPQGSSVSSIDPSDPNKPESITLLSAPDNGIIFPYIAEWEEATGIKVEATEMASDSLHTQLSTLFAAKSAEVDVLWTYVAWTAEFANAGHLWDISAELTQDEWDAFNQGSLNCVSYGGARYGIPKFYSIRSFYCNMDLLRAAGYEEPPKDWDEFLEIAAACTDPAADQYGVLMGMGNNESLSIAYQDILALYGLTFADADGNLQFNTPDGIDAFQQLVDLQLNGSLDPASYGVTSGPERRARFLTGKVAMAWEWAALNKEAIDQGTFEIQAALTPAIKQSSALTGSEGHAISAYSENKEYALDLIRYLASDDVQKRMTLATGWYPVTTAVFEDAEVIAASPIMQVAAEQSQFPTYRYAAPYYTEMVDKMTVPMFEALNGSITATEAIERAAKEAEAVIASYQ